MRCGWTDEDEDKEDVETSEDIVVDVDGVDCDEGNFEESKEGADEVKDDGPDMSIPADPFMRGGCTKPFGNDEDAVTFDGRPPSNDMDISLNSLSDGATLELLFLPAATLRTILPGPLPTPPIPIPIPIPFADPLLRGIFFLTSPLSSTGLSRCNTPNPTSLTNDPTLPFKSTALSSGFSVSSDPFPWGYIPGRTCTARS